MSEDLTKKFSQNDRDTILTAIQKMDFRLQGVEKKIDGIENKVEGIEKKVDGLEKKVEGVEKTVSERLFDTRPIWHKVVADIAQLHTGQQRLEKAMHEVSNTVGNVSRDQIVINDAIRKIQLDFHAINQRLLKLEISHNR